jgi:hypothetical protein
MAYLAAAEFVVVGVGAGVVQDRGAGLHVQGVDEAVVVDEPGVDGLGFAGLASSGERIPSCGVPVTVSSATPTSVRTPAFKKAFTSASTRLSAIRARTRSIKAGCDISYACERQTSGRSAAPNRFSMIHPFRRRRDPSAGHQQTAGRVVGSYFDAGCGAQAVRSVVPSGAVSVTAATWAAGARSGYAVVPVPPVT